MFFYILLCAQLENFLSDLLKRRMHWVRFCVRDDTVIFDRIKRSENGVEKICDSAEVRAAVSSVRRLTEAVITEVQNAPLVRLMNLYGDVFGELVDVIGNDLQCDIMHLGKLRNIFAHGRDFTMTFHGPTMEELVPEPNNLLECARWLSKRGVVKPTDVHPRRFAEFQQLFFSDAVLLHFYAAVKDSQDRIIKAAPERMGSFDRLPELS